jgi:exodeoxyribonuclease-3
MKRIISWNVNGIRACAGKGFAEWLAADSPDVLCLQETKAEPAQLPKELLELKDGEGRFYKSFWASAKKRGYSGTAIICRDKPLDTRLLGASEFDDEGRVIVADFEDYSVVSAYFPNSQDKGARLGYKLEFCAAIREFADAEVAKGRHIVIGGDYNIAHTEIDLANPRQNEGNPGYLPEERAWMTGFLGAGYVDSFRLFEKAGGKYTWWTYRVPSARANNIGWRLDYHCVDPGLVPRVAGASIMPAVMGSDHCPVSILIKDQGE